MSTKLQSDKRKTRQIRISSELHKKIKVRSVEVETTISRLADSILEDYFSLGIENKMNNENL